LTAPGLRSRPARRRSGWRAALVPESDQCPTTSCPPTKAAPQRRPRSSPGAPAGPKIGDSIPAPGAAPARLFRQADDRRPPPGCRRQRNDGHFRHAGVYTPRQVVDDDLGGMSFEDAIDSTIVEFEDATSSPASSSRSTRTRFCSTSASSPRASSRLVSCRSATTSTRLTCQHGRADRALVSRRRTRKPSDPLEEARPVRAGMGPDREGQGGWWRVRGPVIEVVKAA